MMISDLTYPTYECLLNTLVSNLYQCYDSSTKEPEPLLELREDVMGYPSNNRLVDLLRQVPDEHLRSLYARHGVDPAAGPGELIREICLDGANTIASLFRGREGVPYIEVVGMSPKKSE